jgi:molecular chaperone DnaJ|tara:strand:+ start:4199 stop:5131 length:933 start_codon:yes stop_codon:yes gene_type:complete
MNQYYQALGLNFNASEDEIKKAYRKLSKKNHPDLNPNNPKAEENFKKISEAYQILTGKIEKPQQARSQGFNFNNRVVKARPMIFNLHLDLEDIFSGVTKDLNISINKVCDTCNGEGGLDMIFCNQCLGKGAIRQGNIVFMCNNCRGKGFLHAKSCGQCGSTGHKKENKTVSLDIKKDILNNKTIQMVGEGNQVKGGVNGDLIINIIPKKNSIFNLDGFDLKIDKKISILDIFLGSEINIVTLDGEVKMKIPRLSDPNKSFRLKNKGMFKNNKNRGDLFVKLNPKYPQDITPQEEALLNALKNSPNFKVIP